MIRLVILLFLVTTKFLLVGQTSSPPYTKAIKAGPFLYISGTIGRNEEGKLVNESIGAETHQAMKNIEKVLKEHNLVPDDLVSVTIYLTDMKDYDEVNKAYATHFMTRYPTRTCIAVKELPFGGRIEITSTALLK